MRIKNKYKKIKKTFISELLRKKTGKYPNQNLCYSKFSFTDVLKITNTNKRKTKKSNNTKFYCSFHKNVIYNTILLLTKTKQKNVMKMKDN